LNVQEYQVGRMFLDQRERLDAILALANEVNFGKLFSRNASSSRAGFSSSTITVLIVIGQHEQFPRSICDPRRTFNPRRPPFPVRI